jgi:hypothetical protein
MTSRAEGEGLVVAHGLTVAEESDATCDDAYVKMYPQRFVLGAVYGLAFVALCTVVAMGVGW